MPKDPQKSNLFKVTDVKSQDQTKPQYTGRYLVLLAEGDQSAGQKLLAKAAGIKNIASTADFQTEELRPEALGNADALVLPEIGVMIVDGDPDQVAAVAALEEQTQGIEAKEPEQICYAVNLLPTQTSEFATTPDYIRGFRDGVTRLADEVLNGRTSAAEELEVEAWNEAQFTWGLQATRVHSSHWTAKGIRVAVLDTGMDLQHPDFAQRPIIRQSFVAGEPVQDGHGHGTHCIGTSCGPKIPGQPPRYGIGFQAQIHAGKVLSNGGSGGDAGILAGINWAMTRKCQVISMSLGAPVPPGGTFSPVYEGVARRALQAGTLIVAAAGNESGRPAIIRPVGRPANCPSIMAVAALTEAIGVAPFSNGGINPMGGQVDIAGPGVNVYSSFMMPTRYRRLSGTSMATPHVAGCAALHCQATGQTGNALWRVLVSTARRLPLPSRDVGAGLVQAPQ
jgi:subtilisin family serine protease